MISTSNSLNKETERCWEIYNSAWDANWGFVPMSRESFMHEAQVLKYIVWPQFTFMAEVDGEPAGFMIIVPDFHHAFKAIGNGRLLPTGLFKILAAKRRISTGRIMILGAKKEFRKRGIFALFVNEMHRRAKSIRHRGRRSVVDSRGQRQAQPSAHRTRR